MEPEKSIVISILILSILALISTLIGLIIATSILIHSKFIGLTIFVGLMASLFIENLGGIMGPLGIYIYNSNVPNIYCTIEGFIKFYGYILYYVFQILVDYCLYTNIFHLESYRNFYKKYLVLTQILIYGIIFSFSC